MDKKGQGALEYLLLIGGAVLVAVIVITLLLQITTEGREDTEATADAGAIRICEQRNATLCDGALTDYTGNCTPPAGNTAYIDC